MAPGGLLDGPRVRTVQLLTLHGWERLREGVSGHDWRPQNEVGVCLAGTPNPA